MAKQLTIEDAKRLAKAKGLDGLMLIAVDFKTGAVQGVSYGRTRSLCGKTAALLDKAVERLEADDDGESTVHDTQRV